ncbi:uncharacterized protein TNCT_259801 [Trichonephila clavata]|uniref:Uncharacterized protein n=1 Tax=Trichonephila clavata TaxID=2740835 RepID=A0A8X6FLW0_TRICU|nr:uncharacterized protein TNCT_259801 [Trichonephila clavata]
MIDKNKLDFELSTFKYRHHRRKSPGIKWTLPVVENILPIMSILLQLVSLLVCLQTVWLYPIQDDESSLVDNYGMRLAKRPFYPYKDAILSPFGFLDSTRGMSFQ